MKTLASLALLALGLLAWFWFRGTAPQAVEPLASEADASQEPVPGGANVHPQPAKVRRTVAGAPDPSARVGSVVLTLTDDTQTPIAFQAGLLVPWLERARRVTEATDGVVRWDDVPAGDYRWKLLEPAGVHVLLDPPHENESMFDAQGRVASPRPSVPHGVSGVFRVAADETVRLNAVLERSAVVFGRIGAFDPRQGTAGHVGLRHRERHENPTGGAWVESRLQELAVQPQADGYFEFRNVRPGEKSVRARWRTEDGFTFVGADFELAPGEVKDLGVLEVTGTTVTCRAQFHDARGNVFAVDEVLVDRDAETVCTFLWRGAPPLRKMGADRFEVPLGHPFQLRGLADGEYTLKLDAGLPARRRIELHEPLELARHTRPRTEFHVPSQVDVIVPVHVDSFCTLVSDTRRHGMDQEILLGDAFLFSTEDPAAKPYPGDIDVYLPEFLNEPKSGPALFRATLRAPAGEYVAVVHGTTPEGASPVSLFAFQTVRLPDAPRVDLQLDFREAATMTGRLVDDSGAPIRRGLVMAVPQQVFRRSDGRNPEWSHSAEADDDGLFRMTGLPTGIPLVVSREYQVFDVPAAAGEFDVGDVLGY